MMNASRATDIVLNVMEEDKINVNRANQGTTKKAQVNASSATIVVLNVLLVAILPARGAVINIIYKEPHPTINVKIFVRQGTGKIQIIVVTPRILFVRSA